jgi:hypothetical protein
MSKMRTVTPIATIAKVQLKDDVESLLLANGFNLNDLAKLEKQLEYRKQYSQRSEVKEKRAAYSKQRYLKMKVLKALLQDRVTAE